MKHRTGLAVLGFALSAQAADLPRTGTAALACGSAKLQARTTFIAHSGRDNGLVWVAQDIKLTGAGDTSHPLHLSDRDGQPPVTADGSLPVIVVSWQCLHGSQDEVFELWFTCGRPDMNGACRGEREWERLFDLNGRPLDAGYAPQDPRYDALSTRLGIPQDGVKLEDALGN